MKTLLTIALLFMSTVCWGETVIVPEQTTIKGEILLCVVLKDKTHPAFSEPNFGWNYKSSVSCNWEAYNKRKEIQNDK